MLFSPGYMNPLFQSTTGHYMLAYAVVSLLLGHLMIRRIVRIEV